MASWITMDEACLKARMRGATVTQLADILKRAVQDRRLGITGILEDAPIERVREHWPVHALRLELMRTWKAPGRLEDFLNDTGVVAQTVTGLDIEPGNKLRVLILWGTGPPWEADTCLVSQVRLRWTDLNAELEAAGFGANENEDHGESRGRTGIAGRPTSWHLIEAECRRRYKAGERYPNDRAKIESPAEWARVLIAWLKEKHKREPVPAKKSLTNKLSPLLRTLVRGESSPGC